jgi:hypothetical protein
LSSNGSLSNAPVALDNFQSYPVEALNNPDEEIYGHGINDSKIYPLSILTPVSINELQPDVPEKTEDIKLITKEVPLTTRPKSGVEISAFYRMPVTSDGSPGPNAHQLVFFAPGIHSHSYDLEREEVSCLSEKCGFTVFSLSNDINTKDPNDPNWNWWKPDSGWYDLVFEAAQKIQEQNNFPPDKMFIYGLSAGSQMAQRMAVRYPEKFTAIVIASGFNYEELTAKTNIPWLIVYTRRDGGEIDSLDLVSKLREFNDTVTYGTAPTVKGLRGADNYFHHLGDPAISLISAYLWDIYENQINKKESVDPNKWPFVVSSNPSLPVYKSNHNIDYNKYNLSLLPSNSSAYYWSLLTDIPRDLEYTLPGGEVIHLLAVRPKNVKIKGVVWCTTSYNYQNVASVINDLDQLAEEGYYAFALKDALISQTGPEKLRSLASWLTTQSDLTGLPIFATYIFGRGIDFDLFSHSSIYPTLHGLAISNIDGESPPFDFLQSVASGGQNIPTLFIVSSSSSSETIDRLESHLKTRIEDIIPDPKLYMIPSDAKTTGKEEYYATENSIMFFNLQQ